MRKHPPSPFIAAIRTLGCAVLLLFTAGCWNGDVSNIRLGDISLGTQLIDLKRALEDEAISPEEYDAAKAKLIAAYAICESEENGDG